MVDEAASIIGIKVCNEANACLLITYNSHKSYLVSEAECKVYDSPYSTLLRVLAVHSAKLSNVDSG